MGTNNMLSSDYIAVQKRRLLALRASLRYDDQASAKEERSLQAKTVAASEGSGDDVQKINLRDNDSALIAHDVARLDQVEHALAKIEDGTGCSDRSGQPIPKVRLDALPESVLNVEEAERQAPMG